MTTREGSPNQESRLSLARDTLIAGAASYAVLGAVRTAQFVGVLNRLRTRSSGDSPRESRKMIESRGTAAERAAAYGRMYSALDGLIEKYASWQLDASLPEVDRLPSLAAPFKGEWTSLYLHDPKAETTGIYILTKQVNHDYGNTLTLSWWSGLTDEQGRRQGYDVSLRETDLQNPAPIIDCRHLQFRGDSLDMAIATSQLFWDPERQRTSSPLMFAASQETLRVENLHPLQMDKLTLTTDNLVPVNWHGIPEAA